MRYADGLQASPLGGMKNPWYFNYGIAIHGAQNVPDRPASHGAVRISNNLADTFPTLVEKGDAVYVWGLHTGANRRATPRPNHCRSSNGPTQTPRTVRPESSTTIEAAGSSATPFRTSISTANLRTSANETPTASTAFGRSPMRVADLGVAQERSVTRSEIVRLGTSNASPSSGDLVA